MGVLYRLSFPNGKAYIGITAKTAEQRFAVHLSDRIREKNAHLPIYRAIEKYGDDAVKLETLVVADDWGYLCELERKAIAAFGTRSPAGYNATDGGDGAPKGHRYRVGLKHSDEAKAKMSAVRRGKAMHTLESRAKIGAASKGNKHGLGQTHSAATRRKRAISLVTGGLRSSNTSGVKGVGWCKQTNKWRAHITIGGKMRALGRFVDMADAVFARQTAEQHFLGMAGSP